MQNLCSIIKPFLASQSAFQGSAHTVYKNISLDNYTVYAISLKPSMLTSLH